MSITNLVNNGAATPNSGSSGTAAVTTTQTVPAGGKVFAYFAYVNATATAPTMAGGGLTWTVDSTVSNGNARESLAWADAPAGLASGTVLTATLPAASGSSYIASAYSTGVATGVAAARTSGTTGTTAWTSGALTVPSGSLLTGGCYSGSGTNTVTNTPSGGNTEIHDQNIATDSAQTTCYQLGTGASIASQGTWSVSGSPNAAIGVRFDAAAVTADSGPTSNVWPLALRAVGGLRWPKLGFSLPGIFDVPGTVFTDSGSGSLTLTGSGTESHTHSNSATGTITLAGTRVESQAGSNSASGTITLAGTRTESQTGSNSPSGTITLAGTFAQAFSHSGSASGTITLAGTRAESQTASNTASGTITLAGTRTESETGSNSASGTITLGGTGVEDFHAGGSSFNDSGSGTVTLAGTRTENAVFADSRTATVTLAGTGVESFTHSGSRTGTITLTGTANEVWGHVDSGTGTITLAAGARTESQSHLSSSSATVALSGTSQEDFHGFVPADTAGIHRLRRRRWPQP